MHYQEPEMNVVMFESQDVITTSLPTFPPFIYEGGNNTVSRVTASLPPTPKPTPIPTPRR